MEETQRVDFMCPITLLKAFDEAIKNAFYPTRTDALRDLMRKFVKEKVA